MAQKTGKKIDKHKVVPKAIPKPEAKVDKHKDAKKQ
jgi:hypothetical protein